MPVPKKKPFDVFLILTAFFVSLASPLRAQLNACDLNSDGVVNIVDVQRAINQAEGRIPCTNGDLDRDGVCSLADVTRVLNAALGGACVVGPGPGITLSPAALTFGNQSVGTVSPSQPVTLTNNGSTTLNLVNISFTGTNSSDFVETHNCGATVSAGGNCTINVAFNPSTPLNATAPPAPPETGLLTVTGDQTNGPQSVRLTGTGIFPIIDTDQDGIPDVWETQGLTLHGAFVDLPAMGADPHRKDVFVQIDHLNCTGPCPIDPRTGAATDPHNHTPNLDAMKKVILAFDSSPVPAVTNDPQGKPGINLHVDWGLNALMKPAIGKKWADCLADPSDPPNPSVCVTWGSLSQANEIAEDNNTNFDLGCIIVTNPIPPPTFECASGNPLDVTGAFNAIKDAASNSRSGDLAFSVMRRPVFHYAIFGHAYHPSTLSDPTTDTSSGESLPTGSSPMSEPSSDFLVTLGFFRDPKDKDFVGNVIQQAGSFMHELGHNLGLDHGGPATVDSINYKPNYLSVMNWSFQTRGLIISDPGCTAPCEAHVDYSRFGLPPLPIPLDEKLAPPTDPGLDERSGLSGGGTIQSHGTRYYCVDTTKNPPIVTDRIVPPPSAPPVPPNPNDMINGPIDWNCNNSIENAVQADINQALDFIKKPVFTKLQSYEDWPTLIFTGGEIGTFESTLVAPSARAAVLGQTAAAVTISSALLSELTFEQDAKLTTVRGVSVLGPGDRTVAPGGSTVLNFFDNTSR